MIPKDLTTVFDVDNPDLVEVQCKILIPRPVIPLINLDQTYTLSDTEDDDIKPKEAEDYEGKETNTRS